MSKSGSHPWSEVTRSAKGKGAVTGIRLCMIMGGAREVQIWRKREVEGQRRSHWCRSQVRGYQEPVDQAHKPPDGSHFEGACGETHAGHLVVA